MSAPIQPIEVREAYASGSTTSTCSIQLGRGTFELEHAMLNPSCKYAVRAYINYLQSLSDKDVYAEITSGWCAYNISLRMPFRRIIVGPCKIWASLDFVETSTATLQIQYRRVDYE